MRVEPRTRERRRQELATVEQIRPVRSRNPVGTQQINLGSDYTEEEKEFLIAVRRYMKVNRRRYPAFTEILAVAKSLGYRRISQEVADEPTLVEGS